MRFEKNPPPSLDLNVDPAKLDPNDEMESDELVKNFLELENRMSAHSRNAIQVTVLHAPIAKLFYTRPFSTLEKRWCFGSINLNHIICSNFLFFRKRNSDKTWKDAEGTFHPWSFISDSSLTLFLKGGRVSCEMLPPSWPSSRNIQSNTLP